MQVSSVQVVQLPQSRFSDVARIGASDRAMSAEL